MAPEKEVIGQRTLPSNSSDDVDIALEEVGLNEVMARVSINLRHSQRSPRGRLRKFLVSVKFQTIIVLTILVDVSAFVVETVLDERGEMTNEAHWTLAGINIGTLVVYSLDIVLRVVAFGPRNFVQDRWNIVDLFVVLIAVVVIQTPGGSPGGLVVAVKVLRFLKSARLLKVVGVMIRFFRCFHRFRTGSLAAKYTVSKNKLRYVDLNHNFDLDLTYITPDLIAMALPVKDTLQGFYRNPLNEVVRFFKVKHNGHFRVYNACPECPYPDEKFEEIGGSVVHFNVQDHTPPNMEQFLEFLLDVRKFYVGGKRQTIAVHCKAGKGRTGSLCCAWMMYSKVASSSEGAMELFAQQRTDSSKGKICGVETPSQVRYIRQLWSHLSANDAWLHRGATIPPCPEPEIALHCLKLEAGLLPYAHKMKRLKALVQCGGENVSRLALETTSVEATVTSISLEGVRVRGDVRVAVFEELTPDFSAQHAITCVPNANKAKGIILFFLFHTHFLNLYGQENGNEDLTVPREYMDPEAQENGYNCFRLSVRDLDKAHKRIKKGKHLPGSSIALYWTGDESATESVFHTGTNIEVE